MWISPVTIERLYPPRTPRRVCAASFHRCPAGGLGHAPRAPSRHSRYFAVDLRPRFAPGDPLAPALPAGWCLLTSTQVYAIVAYLSA
jgi:hypothetical protein